MQRHRKTNPSTSNAVPRHSTNAILPKLSSKFIRHYWSNPAETKTNTMRQKWRKYVHD